MAFRKRATAEKGDGGKRAEKQSNQHAATASS